MTTGPDTRTCVLLFEDGANNIDLEAAVSRDGSDALAIMRRSRALLRRVWGPGYATHTEYIRVYLRRLRARLETPEGPALIVTEPRSG